jgi:WD40 repeat protein
MPDKEATAIFTREASAFAAAAFSGAVEIWTLKDLVNPAYRFAETSPVVLDVSRAGGRVAISTPNSVKVIDIDLHSRTHREKFRVTDIANYASFSPDGSVLAVSASDETIKLWNVDTGELLLTLAGHEHEATQLAFSRDGKRLASGGKDGAVQVYALTVPELLRIARSRIHRDLTTEECEEYLHSKTCPTMESVFRTISSRGERR